jgi:U3 small nucleolar RNA-associated protein 23
MRHGRAKAARKTLQYFGRTIGLKAPYWILLDATLVAALFQQKILPVKERIDKVLQSTAATTTTPGAGAFNNRYCITQAAIDELEMILKSLEAKQHEKVPTFQQALEWIRKECMVLTRDKEVTNKEEEEGEESEDDEKQKSSWTPAQEDMMYHIQTSEDRQPYVVASQDEDLLHELRSIATVPIVRVANRSVLILEQPSKKSQSQFKGLERKKWAHSLAESERALVELVKDEAKVAASSHSSANQPPPRQKRVKSKAKGPNPLSCKRKRDDGKSTKESASKKRRNRGKKES